jgi:hypothetical protein
MRDRQRHHLDSSEFSLVGLADEEECSLTVRFTYPNSRGEFARTVLANAGVEGWLDMPDPVDALMKLLPKDFAQTNLVKDFCLGFLHHSRVIELLPE